MASASSNICPECGAAVPPGRSCRDQLHALFLLESQLPGAMDGWPHFYAMAAYGLQHPDELCVAAEALADLRATVVDALAGRVTLDGARRRAGRGAAQAARIMRRSAEVAVRRRVEKWSMTVVDVCAGAIEGYAERAERWARSVCESMDADGTEPIAAADQSPENESPNEPLRAHAITIRDSAEPVSSDQLDRIESSLNLPLPAEYRSFLLRANGGIPEPRHFHYIAIDEDAGTRRRQKGKIARFYPATLADWGSGMLMSPLTFYQNEIQCDFPDWLLPIAHVEDTLEGGMLCIALKGKDQGRVYYLPEQEIGEHTLHEVADSLGSFLALLG